MSRARLLQSVALMMVATLAAKALNIIREPIIAAYFGASAQTDAYNVALTIITMLLGVTISPIGGVLVPVYVERLHRSPLEGERFISQVLTLYLVILSSVLLIAYFAAPWLVRLYAPGFAADTSALTLQLTRILALFAVVSGVAGYFNMVLTAHRDFLWVAVSPIVTSALVIAILLLAAPHLGINALAWGMVVGHGVGMFILGLCARQRAVRRRLSLRLGNAIRALGKLSGWMVVGRFIGQGNSLIDRHMLSYLSAGSIAILGFALSIYMLPFEIFTTGITRVIIADFSWDVAEGDTEALKRDLSLAIRMSAFFMVPVTLGLIVLRHPIVNLLYLRGAFDAADARATAAALMLLSIGLFPRAINFIAARVFTSLQSMVFPTVLTLGMLVIHFVANLSLIPIMGLRGVALSLTIVEVVAAIIFLVKTRQMLGLLGGRALAVSLTKMGVASGVMATALLVSLRTLERNTFFAEQLLTQVIVLISLSLVGGFCYLAMLYTLGSRELTLSVKLVRRSVFNKPDPIHSKIEGQ
jgi:putative peptidoglycan lipid II flippase